MTRTTLAALALTALLPLAAPAAHADTGAAAGEAALCANAPAKAAKAGIDCTATSRIDREDDAARKYPQGPVNFGNGIVF